MASLFSFFSAFVIILGNVHRFDGQKIQCPSACSCLGNMVDCSERGLVSVPKDLPSWVTSLDLQSNAISDIEPDAFQDLAKLEQIDLSDNGITSLNETLFRNLSALKVLKINHNKLTEMPKIGRNTSLTHLSLCITQPHSCSHKDIFSIFEILSMGATRHNNHIHTINLHLLEDLPSLRSLDLNYNDIVILSVGTFPKNSGLHQLFMSKNKIKVIDKGCFDNLTQLETLRLNKNEIGSFPRYLFNKTRNLKYLSLTRNSLTRVDGLMFDGLKNLTVLKMKRNMLSFLADGAFYGLEKIQHLHLDYNNITNITKGWTYGLRSLKQLTLSHNVIKHIENNAWSECIQLMKLYLDYNKLTTLGENSFKYLPTLRYLYVHHNEVMYIEDGAFKDLTSLETLDLNNNKISWTIEDMNGAFNGLSSLKKMNLDSNQIRTISKLAFTDLGNIHQLLLQDNAIASIQQFAFEPLTSLQVFRFNSTNLLCDCGLAWFPDWLYEMGFSGAVTPVCGHPENLKGKNMFEVDPNDFKCEDIAVPIIIDDPTPQAVLKSSNLTLRCVAKSMGDSDIKFQWKKGNLLLENAEIENFARSDEDTMEYTTLLHLRNIDNTDMGKYQCVISNEFGSSYSKKAQVTVQVFPEFIKTPKDVTIKEGNTARLECAAKGEPHPVIAWQKDGGDDFPAARERRMHVMTADDVFFIVNVKSTDEGIYSCTATNDAGTIISNTSLSVLQTPSFIRPMENKVTRRGDTTVLECMAFGSPKPKLKWIKDGKHLDVTQRHFFTADSQLLIIVQTQPGDAGTYTCEMSNTLGTEKGSSELHVLSPEELEIITGGVGTIKVNKDTDSDSGGGLDDESTTTGIIIIAVVCCVVGTSLVWVIIIYQTRRRHEIYSATPTDETTLPGEVASSGYNSADREGSLSNGTVTVPGYHYQDYQLKESGYESSSGRYVPNGWPHRPAMYSGDIDDEQQVVPLTLGEHHLASHSGGNSTSSLQYPNSESDTLQSSRSTSSTHTSGHQTLTTFQPHIVHQSSERVCGSCDSEQYDNTLPNYGDVTYYPVSSIPRRKPPHSPPLEGVQCSPHIGPQTPEKSMHDQEIHCNNIVKNPSKPNFVYSQSNHRVKNSPPNTPTDNTSSDRDFCTSVDSTHSFPNHLSHSSSGTNKDLDFASCSIPSGHSASSSDYTKRGRKS